MEGIKKRKSLSPMAKIALGYITLIIIAAGILLLPFSSWDGVSVDFTTALFTSTSAVCVTGLTVVDVMSTFSYFGQVVILLFVQIGGLGFMTMAGLLIMLLGKKLSLKDKLALSETFNSEDMSQAKKFVSTVVVTTLAIELVGAISLFFSFNQLETSTGLAIWRSVYHSVMAFCNAGFDLMAGEGMSVLVSNPFFNVGTLALVFCGGIGASTMVNLRGKLLGKEKITFNTKLILVSMLALFLVGGLYIFAVEFNNPNTIGNLPLGEKLAASFFMSLNIRSSGFDVANMQGLAPSTIFMMYVLMSIGGAPASTAGGIKLTTFVVLLASLRTAVTGGGEYTIAKRSISNKTLNKALSILLIYVIVLVFAVLVMSISDANLGLSGIIFECISAFANCGLSLCGTSNVSIFGQYLLMFLMFLGRAGYICVAYAITNNSKLNIKYPDSKIVIGG